MAGTDKSPLEGRINELRRDQSLLSIGKYISRLSGSLMLSVAAYEGLNGLVQVMQDIHDKQDVSPRQSVRLCSLDLRPAVVI